LLVVNWLRLLFIFGLFLGLLRWRRVDLVLDHVVFLLFESIDNLFSELILVLNFLGNERVSIGNQFFVLEIFPVFFEAINRLNCESLFLFGELSVLSHSVHADHKFLKLCVDWWESDLFPFSLLWSKSLACSNLFDLEGSLLLFMGGFIQLLLFHFSSIFVEIFNCLGVTGN